MSYPRGKRVEHVPSGNKGHVIGPDYAHGARTLKVMQDGTDRQPAMVVAHPEHEWRLTNHRPTYREGDQVILVGNAAITPKTKRGTVTSTYSPAISAHHTTGHQTRVTVEWEGGPRQDYITGMHKYAIDDLQLFARKALVDSWPKSRKTGVVIGESVVMPSGEIGTVKEFVNGGKDVAVALRSRTRRKEIDPTKLRKLAELRPQRATDKAEPVKLGDIVRVRSDGRIGKVTTVNVETPTAGGTMGTPAYRTGPDVYTVSVDIGDIQRHDLGMNEIDIIRLRPEDMIDFGPKTPIPEYTPRPLQVVAHVTTGEVGTICKIDAGDGTTFTGSKVKVLWHSTGEISIAKPLNKFVPIGKYEPDVGDQIREHTGSNTVGSTGTIIAVDKDEGETTYGVKLDGEPVMKTKLWPAAGVDLINVADIDRVLSANGVQINEAHEPSLPEMPKGSPTGEFHDKTRPRETYDPMKTYRESGKSFAARRRRAKTAAAVKRKSDRGEELTPAEAVELRRAEIADQQRREEEEQRQAIEAATATVRWRCAKCSANTSSPKGHRPISCPNCKAKGTLRSVPPKISAVGPPPGVGGDRTKCNSCGRYGSPALVGGECGGWVAKGLGKRMCRGTMIKA